MKITAINGCEWTVAVVSETVKMKKVHLESRRRL